jgi:hypothetical protein
MDKQLRNRESRLRYRARQKGLYIKKGKWYEAYSQYSYETHIGYCVGDCISSFLIAGYDNWNRHLMTIEETEAYVDEY